MKVKSPKGDIYIYTANKAAHCWCILKKSKTRYIWVIQGQRNNQRKKLNSQWTSKELLRISKILQRKNFQNTVEVLLWSNKWFPNMKISKSSNITSKETKYSQGASKKLLKHSQGIPWSLFKDLKGTSQHLTCCS